jgi:hypothetical protein
MKNDSDDASSRTIGTHHRLGLRNDNDGTDRMWCDLITSTLNPLILAVPATVTVVKTGVINKEKTVVWTKTFQPNI